MLARMLLVFLLLIVTVTGCDGGAGALAASAATTAAGAIVKPLFCATLRTSCEFAERTWCEGPTSGGERAAEPERAPEAAESTTEP